MILKKNKEDFAQRVSIEAMAIRLEELRLVEKKSI